MRRLVLGACVLATFAAGCGDDDGGSDPGAVEITASGEQGELTFTATEEVEAGPVEITLVNDSSQEIDGQLAYTEEEAADQEIIGEVRKAISGGSIADFFHAAGGPGQTKPSESSTVTQTMIPGTYYVVAGDGPPATPLAKITVTGEEGGEVDEADGTVSSSEYAFASDGIPSGESEVLLENIGGQWHHFLAGKLKGDATIDEAKRFLLSASEGGGAGPIPFTRDDNEFASTVMDPGVSQIADLGLDPGRYAFYCFIADKQGGPPHIVKGMISEVTVE